MSARAVLLAGLFALAAGHALAQPGEEIPPPPPPPPEGAAREPAAGPVPEITITTRDGEVREEYRYNGILYRVRVVPRRGAPYWLIYDPLGNFRRSDVAPEIAVPQWVIKRF